MSTPQIICFIWLPTANDSVYVVRNGLIRVEPIKNLNHFSIDHFTKCQLPTSLDESSTC